MASCMTNLSKHREERLQSQWIALICFIFFVCVSNWQRWLKHSSLKPLEITWLAYCYLYVFLDFDERVDKQGGTEITGYWKWLKASKMSVRVSTKRVKNRSLGNLTGRASLPVWYVSTWTDLINFSIFTLASFALKSHFYHWWFSTIHKIVVGPGFVWFTLPWSSDYNMCTWYAWCSTVMSI